MIITIVGSEGTGKTTAALQLRQLFVLSRLKVIHLDGENVRSLTGNIDYSETGRLKNAQDAGELVSAFDDRGLHVIVSAVFPTLAVQTSFRAALLRPIIWVHLDFEPYVRRPHGVTAVVTPIPVEGVERLIHVKSRFAVTELGEILLSRSIPEYSI